MELPAGETGDEVSPEIEKVIRILENFQASIDRFNKKEERKLRYTEDLTWGDYRYDLFHSFFPKPLSKIVKRLIRFPLYFRRAWRRSIHFFGYLEVPDNL